MSSKISEKKRRITFGIPAPVSTSSFTSNREEQKAHQRDVLEALGLPDSLNEFLASLDSKNIEELASLSDQPLSDVQVEAFRAAYRHERKAKLVRPQPSSSGTERAPSEQDNTAWSNDEEEDFQSFLSLLTDSRKFSVCLRGDPPGESDLLFSRTLNKILHVEGIPSSVQGEIMRYYHRKSLGHLLGAVRNEDKQTQVITYYAKGAHLVGLQSRQLMKYILQDGFENKKSPYSKRPSLNTNYRPPWKCMTPVKLQNIKSTKTHRTVELEDRIRQLTVKREGKQTLEMVTALKIKVPLKVKNREKLTYDDINQIRRKVIHNPAYPDQDLSFGTTALC